MFELTLIAELKGLMALGIAVDIAIDALSSYGLAGKRLTSRLWLALARLHRFRIGYVEARSSVTRQ